MENNRPDRMPDLAFRMMAAAMAVQDRLFPYIGERIQGFGIEEGMVLVDYGCGPGRYTIPLARAVGPAGKVYAVDVQELALAAVQRKMETSGLENIVPILALGYHANIPPHAADIVFALDMIHNVQEPVTLLGELRRLCRDDGVLIVDDNHRPRERTVALVRATGLWKIAAGGRDHLTCVPASGGEGAQRRG